MAKIIKYGIKLNKDKVINLVAEEKRDYVTHDKLDNSETIVSAIEWLTGIMFDPEEKVFVIAFDPMFRIAKIFEVAHGGVSECMIKPSDILKRVLLTNSERIVMVHNHPSGDPTPSKEDITITKRMIDCCKLLGIRLEDHIVIGDRCYKSLREEELVEF